MRHFVGFELLETNPSKVNLWVAADEVTAISPSQRERIIRWLIFCGRW
ncbi:MAG: hypothetical protein ACRD4S_16825 [Candidatus Acidiferrales bacterium]